jgi:arylsulfatase A-like enzyme
MKPWHLLVALVSSWALALVTQAAALKNVIMIVADDMGYADTGITGLKDFATPNIDSIARDGVFCAQAYVTSPVCSPSRAGFLTGRYQQRFGHEHNGFGPPPFGLPANQLTMGDHFKAAEYVTGAMGKWHLGESDEQHPLNRGFDEFVGFIGGHHSYFPDANRDAKTSKILDGRKPAKWDEYLTTYLGRRAVEFIDRHKDERFFLYVAANAPHGPLHARDSDLEKVSNITDSRRRKYAAMMLALDESVGEILKKIKAAGIENETVVVFFSDNGGPQQGDPSVNGSRNWPYRGGKAQMYEGGIHVPLFLKAPGIVTPSSRYDAAVSTLDLLPTLLAAVGRKPIDGTTLDGVNLLPYLSGEKKGRPHEHLYWRMGAAFGLISGDWKIVWPRREGGAPDNPEQPDFSKVQLYQLRQDAPEKQDLARQEPQRLEGMLATWKQWDATLASPLWGSKRPGTPATRRSDQERDPRTVPVP